MSYRQSFFFLGKKEAEAALPVVDEHIKPLDSFINEPTDEETSYEVKLLTEGRITEIQTEIVILFTQPKDYMINCEKYQRSYLA